MFAKIKNISFGGDRFVKTKEHSDEYVENWIVQFGEKVLKFKEISNCPKWFVLADDEDESGYIFHKSWLEEVKNV